MFSVKEKRDIDPWVSDILNARKQSLDEKFKEVDEKNPFVYATFKRFTLMLIEAGKKHYSADRVFHDIRGDTPMDMRDETYKINNNYISRYARKFMLEYPEHAGFFRTRQLKT